MSRYLEKIFYSICLIFMVLSTEVGASDDAGKYAIKGSGAGTCAQFLEARSNNNEQFYLFAGWMNGFITGYNRFSEKSFDLAPWQSTILLVSYIEKYCKEHPDTQFHLATTAMLKSLMPERAKTRTSLVPVKVGDKKISLYSEVISKMQSRLKELNLYSGTVDGKYGNGTINAVKIFQKQNDIKQSGFPNQATLYKLLVY